MLTTRRRIAALALAFLMTLGLSTALPVAANAGPTTQVCHSQISKSGNIGITTVYMRQNQARGLARGTCISGVNAIWTYDCQRTYITNYGIVGPGQYNTPKFSTYTVYCL